MRRGTGAIEDDWLESLRRMAGNGVRLRMADDSRESVYEGSD